ncbi:MAG: hypothetical protein J7515_02230 [Caulobacter sp.]|nr:hypothetical protein [Caulobacter sp.]
MSWIHWLIVLPIAACFVAAFLWPGARILQRAGLSPWWLLICLLPGGAFVGYVLLAFVPWPALEGRGTEG